MSANMKMVHTGRFTREIKSLLESEVGRRLSEYSARLSLRSYPLIILCYNRTHLLGAFVGELSPRILKDTY